MLQPSCWRTEFPKEESVIWFAVKLSGKCGQLKKKGGGEGEEKKMEGKP